MSELESQSPKTDVLIDSLVKAEMLTDFQVASNQQQKKISESNEKRQSNLKEEVKKSFALALSINSKLEQEAGSLKSILKSQFDQSVSHNSLAETCTTLFEKYGDWMAVHEYKLKNLENAVGDLDDLNLDVNPLDEERKGLKKLSNTAESKHLSMKGKREAVGLAEVDLIEMRQEVDKSEQDLC